jgi:hypothetical protein
MMQRSKAGHYETASAFFLGCKSLSSSRLTIGRMNKRDPVSASARHMKTEFLRNSYRSAAVVPQLDDGTVSKKCRELQLDGYAGSYGQ